MLGHDHLWKLLGQRLVVFPVDGAAVAIEQTGLRHQVGAGVNAAQRQPKGGHFFQPQRERPQAAAGNGVGANHKHHVQGRRVSQAVLRHDLDAVARRHQAAIDRQQHRPVGGAPQHAVGNAQRIYTGAERNERKVRHHHKAEHQRLLGQGHGVRRLRRQAAPPGCRGGRSGGGASWARWAARLNRAGCRCARSQAGGSPRHHARGSCARASA